MFSRYVRFPTLRFEKLSLLSYTVQMILDLFSSFHSLIQFDSVGWNPRQVRQNQEPQLVVFVKDSDPDDNTTAMPRLVYVDSAPIEIFGNLWRFRQTGSQRLVRPNTGVSRSFYFAHSVLLRCIDC